MMQTQTNDLESYQSRTSAVETYFRTLNQGQLDLTAALFSEKGQLIPPFDSPVVGRQAIADYLKQEATDMNFYPTSETTQVLVDGRLEVKVKGKVSTSAFSVKVVWNFIVADAEIDLVMVNLLASLQELINIRPEG